MNPQNNKQEEFPIYPRQFNWLLISFAFVFLGLLVGLDCVLSCQTGLQAVLAMLGFVFIFGLILISSAPYLFFVSLAKPKGPELVFSKAGITFSDLGLLPWTAIVKIATQYNNHGGRRRVDELIIELNKETQWKPQNEALFGISKVSFVGPHVIIVDLRYLRASRSEISKIYQKLSSHTDLKHIDVAALYKPINVGFF